MAQFARKEKDAIAFTAGSVATWCGILGTLGNMAELTLEKIAGTAEISLNNGYIKMAALCMGLAIGGMALMGYMTKRIAEWQDDR